MFQEVSGLEYKEAFCAMRITMRKMSDHQIGHDPAERLVDRDLASQALRPDALAGLVQGHAGLVTAGLDPKNTHRQTLQVEGGMANMPLLCRPSRLIFL